MAILNTEDGSQVLLSHRHAEIVVAIRAEHAPTAPAVILTIDEARELAVSLASIIKLATKDVA